MHKCNGTDGNDNNAIDDENHDDDNDLIAKVAEERSKCKGCNRSDPTFNLRLTVNRIYIRVYQNVNKNVVRITLPLNIIWSCIYVKVSRDLDLI